MPSTPAHEGHGDLPRQSGSVVPESLAGTAYEHLAHELAAKEDELTPVGQWRVSQGANSNLMRGQPGNTMTWESGDDEYSLVIAEFSTEDFAQAAYELFLAHEESWNIGVEGSVAVTRNLDGTTTIHHATDHSVARGAAWGIAAGVAIGVLFPPSVLIGAIAVGTGGALTGKGLGKGHKSEMADELVASTTLGSTRLILLTHDRRRQDHGGSF